MMSEIVKHFEIFPVSSRNQIAKLFYPHTTDPERRATKTCRTLVDRGIIEVNREFLPYMYFAKPLRIKMRSSALSHHLGLVDLYMQLDTPRFIKVEHSFGKEFARPDMIVHIDHWYFIEYQPSIVPTHKMQKKIDLYEETYIHRRHEEFCKEFVVWIVSPKKYDLKSHLKVIQTKGG